MNFIPNRATKVGRNEPCPCGSKKKFKKCHGSPTPPERTPGRIDANLKKLRPDNKCFAPPSFLHECAKGIINSHTVSKSGSLGDIARDGHVYSLKPSLKALDATGGIFIPQLTGWKDASTFPGFCGYHDKTLFSPLEDTPFTGSKEQCFLLAYRAIALEMYAKSVSHYQKEFRHALSYSNPEARKNIDFSNYGTDLGMQDAIAMKAAYDAVMERGDWTQICGILFEFDTTYPIQCTSSFFPDYDVHGNVVQDVGDNPKCPDVICIISFAADSKSYFCLLWLEEHNESCSAFAASLQSLPTQQLPSVIGAILLQRSENCHLAPTWYEGLSAEGKNWCAERTLIGTLLPDAFSPPAMQAYVDYFKGISVTQVRDL